MKKKNKFAIRREKKNMEKVISLDNHYNANSYSNYEDTCEWDSISNIFNKIIKKNKLDSQQVNNMIKKVKFEVRGK
jgi:hypothetical protein